MAACPSCGLEFSTGERFCPNDGTRLDPGDMAATNPIGPDPLIGKVLDGRYKIDRKLGEGGMGSVYKAIHTGMDKPVAVKILRGQMARDEIAAKRFQREAKSASRLDHEHCIRTFDFGHTDDGLMFLAMEFLDGKTLGEEIYQIGSLPPGRAVDIARQVCAALAHAHDLGLIHRDLKPDNVFLTVREGKSDFVKVLDFGLAKLLEREPEYGADGRPLSISTLTEAGTVFGTPEYMSPEQAEGRPLDPRTDLYSLGVVLYQMITGQLPFQAPSFIGILTKHLTETPVAPVDRRPDLGIPPALSALVMRCLAKDPGLRPPGARALGDELARVDLTAGPRIPKQIAQAATINLPPSLPDGGTAKLPQDLQAALAASAQRSHTNAPATSMSATIDAVDDAGGRRKVLFWLALPLVLGAVALVVWLGKSGSATSAAAPPDAAPAKPPDAAPIVLPDAAPVVLSVPDAGPPTKTVRPVAELVREKLAAAGKLHAAGNHLKELAILDEARGLAPSNPTVLYEFGRCLIENGNQDKGCETLKRSKDKRAKSLYDAKGCSLVGP